MDMNNNHQKSYEPLELMRRIHSRKYGLANFKFSSPDLESMETSNARANFMLGNIVPKFTTIVGNESDVGSHGKKVASPADGAGFSLDNHMSEIKAFGEFIERNCGFLTLSDEGWDSKTIFGSYKNLTSEGLSCLDLSELILLEDSLYTNPNFPYARYSPEDSISWYKGKNLICGTETWLPSQKVFLRFPKHGNEPNYLTNMSTGLACGTGSHQAIINALYEVVERDSFILTWLLKIPGVEIEVDEIQNKELSILYKHICKYLVGEDKLMIYDISRTDGIYTILTCIRNDLPGAYGLVVSAASNIDPERALFKVLEEVCQIQSFGYSHLFKDEKREYQHMEKEDVNDLLKHSFYYSTGRNSHKIDFISREGKSVRLSEMPIFNEYFIEDYPNALEDEGILKYLIYLFKVSSQPIYVADITKSEFASMGFRVVKAIIPGYLDLTTHYQHRAQKSRRLSKFQEIYGEKLNDDPHPFA
jgi:ribosomal protein S12 methylthiotransferase accessory factor